MLVTLSGIFIQMRCVHSEKAQSPILVILLGILILVSELHLLKASPPILVTLLGILILVSELHLLNLLFYLYINVGKQYDRLHFYWFL